MSRSVFSLLQTWKWPICAFRPHTYSWEGVFSSSENMMDGLSIAKEKRRKRKQQKRSSAQTRNEILARRYKTATTHKSHPTLTSIRRTAATWPIRPEFGMREYVRPYRNGGIDFTFISTSMPQGGTHSGTTRFDSSRLAPSPLQTSSGQSHSRST